jgi:hypothetical protein
MKSIIAMLFLLVSLNCTLASAVETGEHGAGKPCPNGITLDQKSGECICISDSTGAKDATTRDGSSAKPAKAKVQTK